MPYVVEGRDGIVFRYRGCGLIEYRGGGGFTLRGVYGMMGGIWGM